MRKQIFNWTSILATVVACVLAGVGLLAQPDIDNSWGWGLIIAGAIILVVRLAWHYFHGNNKLKGVTRYSGHVYIDGKLVGANLEVKAKVGDYPSKLVTTNAEGYYDSLEISPPNNSYVGLSIEFYVDGEKASRTDKTSRPLEYRRGGHSGVIDLEVFSLQVELIDSFPKDNDIITTEDVKRIFLKFNKPINRETEGLIGNYFVKSNSYCQWNIGGWIEYSEDDTKLIWHVREGGLQNKDEYGPMDIDYPTFEIRIGHPPANQRVTATDGSRLPRTIIKVKIKPDALPSQVKGAQINVLREPKPAIGGLIGHTGRGTKVRNSHYKGKITIKGTSEEVNVGGLIGQAEENTEVVDSSADAEIEYKQD